MDKTLAKELELVEAVTVSYTHLDVYKRQEDNGQSKKFLWGF